MLHSYKIRASFLPTGGGYQNILVIGADALSKYVDWTDRGTCILFGDAAGAVLVQARVFHDAAMLNDFRFLFGNSFHFTAVHVHWFIYS